MNSTKKKKKRIRVTLRPYILELDSSITKSEKEGSGPREKGRGWNDQRRVTVKWDGENISNQ